MFLLQAKRLHDVLHEPFLKANKKKKEDKGSAGKIECNARIFVNGYGIQYLFAKMC